MTVQINHIQKKFKKKEVLQDVSFQALPSDFIGILGENGCGKSTLLSILAGIQKADGGSFLFQDKDLFKHPKLRSQLVGYVPQGTPLLQELTALDNLKLWYELSHQNLAYDLEHGVPALLGIPEFLQVPVYKMSGGMKKRLSISCAVAHKPRILLLDEPSAALDLICKERINKYFAEYTKQGGIIVLATHDPQQLPLCNKCFILKHGCLSPYTYDGDIANLVKLL